MQSQSLLYVSKFARVLIYSCINYSVLIIVGSVVEWLKHRADDRHDLGSKPTRAILLCPWERHFTALSPGWWSWQEALNYSNISTKLLADSNVSSLKNQVLKIMDTLTNRCT